MLGLLDIALRIMRVNQKMEHRAVVPQIESICRQWFFKQICRNPSHASCTWPKSIPGDRQCLPGKIQHDYVGYTPVEQVVHQG